MKLFTPSKQLWPLMAASLSVLCASRFVVSHAAEETPVEPTALLPNGGFEDGLQGWTVPPTDTMSTLSREQAATGQNSLRVVDADATQGSDVYGPRVPVKSGLYQVRGQGFIASGEGLGVYAHRLDADGKRIGQGDEFFVALPTQTVGKWMPFRLNVPVEEGVAFVQLWIHSYGKAQITAFVDDLTLVRVEVQLKPPFEGTYKIRPEEKQKLTAADVVGPDGVVYPDWRYAGKPGGIPQVPVVARVEEFGAKPDDGKDDSDALEKGAEAVGKRGGGALLLGEGVYDLMRPVVIAQDGVVLRGMGRDAQGRNKTRLMFRFGAPKDVQFFKPAPNEIISSSSWIEAHAAPKDLRSLRIEVDGQQVANTTYYAAHWGATFSLRAGGSAIVAKAAKNTQAHTLKAIAQYADGSIKETTLPIRVASSPSVEPARVPSFLGAIMFLGRSNIGSRLKLARDGQRGDRELLLESATNLQAGDRISLTAPATPRWNALVRNAAPWGEYRRNEYLIEAVQGNTVRLNQPLRIQFPVVDESFIEEIFPLRNCGVEDFALEQTQDVWTSGVVFSRAWECWARGVTIKKAGRFPLYCTPAKWCEVRDCRFDDAWSKGGGGTAYIGWERAYDCLMDGVETWKLRHAPLVQWSASGNVVRRGVFHDSDAQWHSGWTNENLFEQCVVESKIGNGGYGYGMWGSPPEDAAHGPNGPRNVIYNCDVSSPKAGLWMGGMNENWLVLHNRFRVGSGPGVFAKDASFDHILRGNVFILEDANAPAVQLNTPDCIGIELRDNRIFGGAGKASGGIGRLAENSGNRFEPLSTAEQAARPQPAVPSIFEWQRASNSS